MSKVLLTLLASSILFWSLAHAPGQALPDAGKKPAADGVLASPTQAMPVLRSNPDPAEFDTTALLALVTSQNEKLAAFTDDAGLLPDGTRIAVHADSYSHDTWFGALELASRAENSPGPQPDSAPAAGDSSGPNASPSLGPDSPSGQWPQTLLASVPVETLPESVLKPGNDPVSAPEPSSLGLLGLGVLGMLMARRRAS